MDNFPAIVVPVFRRLASLQRLIHSLEKAEYMVKPILHFIIDGDAAKEVIQFCTTYTNHFFRVTFTIHERNLGVDENVLYALSLSDKYGAVIVLEDDAFVSPQFYKYAVQANEVFNTQPDIAGISLYKYLISQPSGLPFYPMHNGNDFFAYQKVSSRGLLISKTQWQLFQNWFEGHDRISLNQLFIPDYIMQWSDNCWEKKFNQFLIAFNMFIAYPYESLSTVFGEEGEHVRKLTEENAFHVPLLMGSGMEWKVLQKLVYYDSYSERVTTNNIEMDLYGCKPLRLLKRKQIITSRKVSKFVKSFGRNLKPHELNIDYGIEGTDFFLVDADNYTKIESKTISARYREWEYYYGDTTLIELIKFKLKQIAKRIFKI